MFHFNHQFETISNLDNLKPSTFDLPTTTHNSPGSLKSSSWKLQDSPMNCSFDEGSQSNNASAIWDASVKYLQASLTSFVNTFTGFNDQSIHKISQPQNVFQFQKQKSIQTIIEENTYFKSHQKFEFLSDLESQHELKDLLRELSTTYDEKIFQELSYVVFRIWEKKNQHKNLEQLKCNNDKSLIPHFDCFWDEEEEECSDKKIAKFSWAPIFQSKAIQEVIAQADKCCDQIAEDIFFDKKMKFFNLKTVSQECKNEFELFENYNQFFRTLTRSVYMSCEGFFDFPKNEKQTDMNEEESDFDFDEKIVSDFTQIEQYQNKFVRSFDQVFEDDEIEFEFCSIPNKKRKLQ